VTLGADPNILVDRRGGLDDGDPIEPNLSTGESAPPGMACLWAPSDGAYDKGIAAFVAAKVANRERTPGTLESVSRAAAVKARRLNLPPDVRDKVLVSSIAEGYSRNAALEGRVLRRGILPKVGNRSWLVRMFLGETPGAEMARRKREWSTGPLDGLGVWVRAGTGAITVVLAYRVWRAWRRGGMSRSEIAAAMSLAQALLVHRAPATASLAQAVGALVAVGRSNRALVEHGWNACIAAPLIEEAIKRPWINRVVGIRSRFGWAGLIIAVVETISRCQRRGWAEGLRISILPTLLHLVTPSMPFLHAVALHAAFNLNALVQARFSSPRGSIGLAPSFPVAATAPAIVGDCAEQIDCVVDPVRWAVRPWRRPLLSSCYDEQGYPPIEPDPTMGSMWGGDEERCKARPGAWLQGPALGCAIPFVNRPCVHNERRAVAGRVLMKPVKEDPNNSADVKAAWNTSWRHFQGTPLYSRIVAEEVMPTPLRSWLWRFPKGTRLGLEKALEDGPRGHFSAKELQYEAFVKRELLVKHTALLPYGKAHEPRLIQGRSFPVRVATGPWTHAFGKHVARCARRAHAYMSGKSSEWVGRWFVEAYERASAADRTGSVVVLSIDHRRFDARVIVAALKLLLRLETLCGAPEAVREVYAKRMTKVGYTPSRVFYTCKGEVGSGDGDTGVGDDLMNRIATTGVLASVDPSWLADDSPVSAISMSDDLNIIMGRCHFEALGGADGIKARYAEHNFEAEVAVGDLLDDVDTCSARLWPVEGNPGWVLGPKPGRVFSKLFWTIKTVPEHQRRAHVRGVCLGLHKSTGFVPVIRALVARMLAITADLGDVPIVRRDRWEGRVEARRHHCLDAPRAARMMERLYDVTWGEVLAAESRIGTLTDAPALVDDPILARIALVDWS
jgi:hypothetical protein